jgi:transcriptional regulator
MYVHSAFQTDPSTAQQLLLERGFGTLIATDEAMPVAAHVPFLFSPEGTQGMIELHVARANPIHEAIRRNPAVLLACTGADAYISPDWYVSENQVPTWNYVAVHAAGSARIMDPSDLAGHVDRLAAHFEAWLPKAPWTTAKMDGQRLAAMLNAIVGIVVEVKTVQAQAKLGQHKGRPDHEGAVAGLRALGDPNAVAVADLMEAARAPGR